MSWTTADLLTSAKLRAFEPDSGGRFTDAEWLQLGSDELFGEVFPLVLSSQGDFRVAQSDTSITAGTATYRIPKRAHAGRLKDVLSVDASGNVRSLPMINLEEIGHRLSAGGADYPGDLAFYMVDDSVGLDPSPSTSTGSIRMKYYMRPGSLVATSSCAQVTAVATTTLTFATGAITTLGWTTATELDFISNTGTFRTIEIDQTPSSTATNSLTFSSLPTGIEVGDWVCPAGQACIPQIPEAVHPYLAQRMAIRALAASGDRANAGAAYGEAQEMKARLVDLLEPRMDGESKVIVPRYSPLRSADDYWRRWSR